MLVETHIQRLSQFGEGVGQCGGRSVFVDEAVPGDRVLVEVRDSGKVLRGRVVELLDAGPSRQESRCPLSHQCGGCDWLHLKESAQLEAKQEILLSSLERLGGLDLRALRIIPFRAAPKAWGYRRRAVLHWAGGKLGFYRRRSHEAVPVDHCPALVGALCALPGSLTDVLKPVSKGIDEVTIIEASNQVAVAVKLRGRAQAGLLQRLERNLKPLGVRGIVLLPQKGSPVLLGRPVVREPAPLCPGVYLAARPDAFLQANAAAAEHLVGSALEALNPAAGDRALELFCGIGTFTFALARRLSRLLAIDSSPAALESARSAAAAGGVENVRFVRGEALKVARRLVDEGQKFDLGLLDPPRTGASGAAPIAKALGMKKVVYVSCDASSLARDAAQFAGAGFRAVSVELVDMFPQTRHIEALIYFESRLLG